MANSPQTSSPSDTEQRILHFLETINRLIDGLKPSMSLEEIADRVVKSLEESGLYRSTWILLYGNLPVLRTSLPSKKADDLEEMVVKGYGSCRCLEEAKRNHIAVIEDPASHCAECPLYDPDNKCSIRCARLAVEGHFFGYLNCILPPNGSDSVETLLFQRLVQDLSIFLRARRVDEWILQAKREWESTVDAIPDLIALIDRDLRIVRCNRAMAEFLGMEPEELVGLPCYELMHGRGSPPPFCRNVLMLQDEKGQVEEVYDQEMDRYFEISVAPYRDPDGTVVGSVHIVRDITARKQAEKERDNYYAQLLQAQKLEAVGQLAAGIAHEINTPTQYVSSNIDFLGDAFQDLSNLISTLLGVVNLSKREGRVPEELFHEVDEVMEECDWEFLQEEIPKAVEQAKEGVGKVIKIVRAMKDFSHPPSLEMDLNDLNHIVDTTVTISRNEWKYVAELELDLDPTMPSVPCLADELGQVLLNMIVNAAHAIEEKLGPNPEGNLGKITITTRHDGEWAIIEVTDDGTGIPQEIRDRIFDPFFTTKEVGKGSGQGLAIARHVVVKKHGGLIEVESTEGEGTTFRIKLPLQRSKDEKEG